LAADGGAFGVVGFLEVVLGLQANEEISGDAEAGLEAEGDGRADAFFLAKNVVKLGGADFHGLGGGGLGEPVMIESVPNESGGGVGLRVGDFEGVPWNGGWFQFHFWSGLVGVLDSDEVDVFHFCIFPLEDDSPWGFA